MMMIKASQCKHTAHNAQTIMEILILSIHCFIQEPRACPEQLRGVEEKD